MKKDAFPDKEKDPDGSGPPFFLIFTDLDGTLLDRDSYRWEEAIPALELCRKRGVPVILASSKTRAEMDCIRRRLTISDPFISENGGAVFFSRATFDPPPRGSSPAPTRNAARGSKDLWALPLGMPYPRLIETFREIRTELGWKMKGFSDLGVEAISRLTGLSLIEARKAKAREYDEPFIIDGKKPEDLAPLHRTASEKCVQVISGGRFYHLQGKNDKAKGMELVTGWYRERGRKVLTVALGDSPNDFGMLERADFPVLIRSERAFPGLKKRIPGLRVTQSPGPRGWNSAVLNILNSF